MSYGSRFIMFEEGSATIQIEDLEKALEPLGGYGVKDADDFVEALEDTVEVFLDSAKEQRDLIFERAEFGMMKGDWRSKYAYPSELKEMEETMKPDENKRPKHWMPRVGDVVDYHSIIGGPITSTGHKVTTVSTDSAKQPVAWLEGGDPKAPSGCVHCDALTPHE